MSRILSIDYGTKRTGIAVTDPLQLIASGLTTIHTKDLLDFVDDYLKEEEVEKIVVGMPTHADGNPVKITHLVVGLVRKLDKKYPAIEVVTQDERYTSIKATENYTAEWLQKKRNAMTKH